MQCFMRRQDRKITEIAEIRNILESSDCIRLAMQDEQGLYLVPMNFGFTLSDSGSLTFYLHSASEGRKITALRAKPEVAFELDCSHALKPGTENVPCHWGFYYASVTGSGTVRFLTDFESRTNALNTLMQHYAHRNFQFTPEMLSSVTVLALEVSHYCAKSHRP